MEQLIPVTIMFTVTFLVTVLFLLPVALVKNRHALIKFYFSGFWGFLALITAVAGGMNTLMLARIDVQTFAQAALVGILAAFVIFVMFAWVRLVGFAAFKVLKPKLRAVFAG